MVRKTSKATPATFRAAGQAVTGVRPDRAGKRLIAGHFDPALARQVKMLAASRDTTVQSLLGEALELLLLRYGVRGKRARTRTESEHINTRPK